MKKILKKEVNISIDKTMVWALVLIIFVRSLTGKNPPEEIRVKAKFKELKDLIEKKFKIIKITRVIAEYNRKIFNACFKTSELSKDIKFVNVFLKFSS